jgi:ubiquinone/menaquinone biosynthesis C-methylase UbiE
MSYGFVVFLFLLSMDATASDCSRFLAPPFEFQMSKRLETPSHIPDDVFVSTSPPHYRSYVMAHITGERHFPLDTVLQVLKLNQTKRMDKKKVLSIGEGYSGLLPWLRRYGAEPIGLDLIYHLTRFPTRKAQDEINSFTIENSGYLIAGDGRYLPFANESFDAIFSSFVFHYMLTVANRDPYSAITMLQEAARVLKVGGEARFSMFWDDTDYLQDVLDSAFDKYGDAITMQFSKESEYVAVGPREYDWMPTILLTVNKNRALPQ